MTTSKCKTLSLWAQLHICSLYFLLLNKSVPIHFPFKDFLPSRPNSKDSVLFSYVIQDYVTYFRSYRPRVVYFHLFRLRLLNSSPASEGPDGQVPFRELVITFLLPFGNRPKYLLPQNLSTKTFTFHLLPNFICGVTSVPLINPSTIVVRPVPYYQRTWFHLSSSFYLPNTLELVHRSGETRINSNKRKSKPDCIDYLCDPKRRV